MHTVAVVGGRGAHAAVYAAREDCTLAALANHDPEDRAALAEEYGVDRTFADHGAMLEAVDPDVVSVVVPERDHALEAMVRDGQLSPAPAPAPANADADADADDGD